jgi:hypothetical protein
MSQSVWPCFNTAVEVNRNTSEEATKESVVNDVCMQDEILGVRRVRSIKVCIAVFIFKKWGRKASEVDL